MLKQGKKITIARLELPLSATFEVAEIKKPKVIFENKQILALDKPPFVKSYDLSDMFEGWSLLHRLDKQTSGVILLIQEIAPFISKPKKPLKNKLCIRNIFAYCTES